MRGPVDFYHGTKAIEVQHPGFVVRYCEIRGAAKGVQTGTHVTAGQIIAYVGRMYTMSMLHFELYAGTQRGPLTDPRRKPFMRRSDLVDPTPLLDRLSREVVRSHLPVQILQSGGQLA